MTNPIYSKKTENITREKTFSPNFFLATETRQVFLLEYFLEKKDEKILSNYKKNLFLLSQTGHPVFPDIYSFNYSKTKLTLILEAFSGVYVQEIREQLSPAEKIKLILMLADALDFIHKKNLIHGNLNPYSFLVSKKLDLTIKILDSGLYLLFPLIKKNSCPQIKSDNLFLSPEQKELNYSFPDPRSDIFSLGCLFYFLFSKNSEEDLAFFRKNSFSSTVLTKYFNLLSLDPLLQEILLKLLHFKPENRYQNAKEVKKELIHYLKTKKKHLHPVTDNSSFTGRMEALLTIKKSYQNIFQTMGQALLIHGCSGIGKTKLVERFKKTLNPDETLFFKFTCSDQSKNIPYAPFIDLIKSYLKELSTQELKTDFFHLLKNELISLIPFIPEIKKYLETDFSKQPVYLHLDKQKILESFALFFTKISIYDKPVILFLDNFDLADSETIQLVIHLIPFMIKSRLMLICSLKDQFLFDSAANKKNIDLPILFWLELKPFQKNEVKEFLNTFFNESKIIPPQIVDYFYLSSLGNPLLLNEKIKDFYSKGIISFKDNLITIQYNQIPRLNQIDTMTFNILLQRLSTFNKKEKEVLSIASVLENNFTSRDLENFFYFRKGFHDKILIEKVLEKSKKEQIMDENLFLPDKKYTFIHNQLKETIYHKISQSEKRALHTIYAELLENKYKDNIEEGIYYIAYHYNQTKHMKKMLDYNHMAYQKALSLFSFNEAAYFMKKIADFHIEARLLQPKIISLIVQLCDILQSNGNILESLKYLEKVQNHARENKLIQEQIEIYIRIGAGHYYLNHFPDAIDCYEKALKTAEKNQQTTSFGLLYFLLASSLWFVGDLKRAENFLDQSLSAYQNDWENKLAVYSIRSVTYISRGKISSALQDIEIMEKQILNARNPMIIPQVYHSLTLCYLWSYKDYDKALEYSLKAYQNAKSNHNIIFIYSSLCGRAMVYLYQKKYSLALKTIEQSIEVSQENNIFIGIHFVWAYKAEIYLWNREYAQADSIAEDYLSDKNKLYEQLPLLFFYKSKASFLFYEKRYIECLAFIEKALNIYDQTELHIAGIYFYLLQRKIYEKEGLKEEFEKTEIMINKLLIKNSFFKLIKENDEALIEDILLAVSEKKDPERLSMGDKLKIENIFNISKVLVSFNNIEILICYIMDKLFEILGAERGAFLKHQEEKDLWQYVFSAKMTQGHFSVLDYLLKKIKIMKKPLLYSGSNEKDLEFFYEIYSEQIKSCICLPVLINHKLYGFFYFDSLSLPRLFSEDDLEYLKILLTQISLHLENFFLKKNLESQEKKSYLKDNLYHQFDITKREKEIIQLLIQGRSNKEISEDLFISLSTVKSHIYWIFDKTGVKNRVELANLFQ